MADYQDLIAWKKAMRMAMAVYDVTRAFPKDELYGLTSQLRRAAVSVPSNIAEGQARFSHNEFQHFLSNSRGSLAEVETQLLLARELGYLDAEKANVLLNDCAELGRIINGLRQSLRDRKVVKPN